MIPGHEKIETFAYIGILLAVVLLCSWLSSGCSVPYRIGDKKNDGFCWTKEAYRLEQEQKDCKILEQKDKIEELEAVTITISNDLHLCLNFYEELRRNCTEKDPVVEYFEKKEIHEKTGDLTYIAAENDWLSKISKMYWNDYRLWPLIYWLNPEIKDFNLIYPNDELFISYDKSKVQKAIEFHNQNYHNIH